MSTRHLLTTLTMGVVAVAELAGCVNGGGDARESSVRQAVLAAPTGVKATATSSTRVWVTWDAVPGATLEYVYRSDDGGGTFNAIAAVHAPDNSFKSADLSAGTTYQYAIASYDPSDRALSPLSRPASATTPLDATGVTATATSPTRVNVTWADARTTL